MTLVSITDEECVKCSRDVKVCADALITAIEGKKYDAVILPGGAGWKNLAKVSLKFLCLNDLNVLTDQKI